MMSMLKKNRIREKENWEKPPLNLALPEDEVHVWRASLEVPIPRIIDLHNLLSEDEVSRAGRYYFERDRRRFIVGRGQLREILCQYLGIDPQELTFDYNHYGRPELSNNHKEIHFNLSHAGETVLYAITCGREVGIDIEYLHRDVDMELIIRRNCSEREKLDFDVVPGELKREALFNCWTRKEAYIKAQGDGLALSLNKFSVSLLPGEPAELIDTQGGVHETARWIIAEIDAGPGYIASIAIECQGWRMRKWEWFCEKSGERESGAHELTCR